jgi:hypothetical protein
MSKRERILVLLAIVLGSMVLLPATVFVLIALWPQRILVSWLLFSLVGLMTLARIAVWLIHAVTMAKVRLNEEALRPGRLYAHERLVEHEQGNDDVKSVSQESWQTPYSFQEKLVSHSYTNGLAPLSMEQDE